MVAYDWVNLTAPVYDLFVKYTFGSVELTIMFLILFVIYVSYQLRLSADAMLVILIPLFIVLGAFIASWFGVLITMGIGLILFAVLKKIKGGY